MDRDKSPVKLDEGNRKKLKRKIPEDATPPQKSCRK